MRLWKVKWILGIAVLLLITLFFGKTSARAADFTPVYVELVQVGSGLTQPLFITHAGDSTNRLFIVERAGRIRIIKNGSLLSTPFLDIDPIVNSSSGEQGLLALAFHPQYESNGQFYTAHTAQDGSLVLSRILRSQNNPDLANAGSQTTLLSIPHPTHTNHNGGTLAFGPDGYLYWSTGDGGGAGDTANNAQSLNVLLGKILRLNVNSGSPYGIPSSNPFFNSTDPNIRKEIWAYGLRNPWRISFDRLTGDLFIGDVGQGVREEIDFQPAASAGGENYGWRVMEGSLCYNASSCNRSGKVLPVAEYDHSLGCSVTGGYVYRGANYPALKGYYFYGDFCSGRLFSLRNEPGSGWQSGQVLDTSYTISTFGEDEGGELYLADYSGGKIYRLTSTTFGDVPPTHMFYRQIEAFFQEGLTVGCSQEPREFCPGDLVTRGEMAVFLERAMGNFNPNPNPTGMFADVPYPGQPASFQAFIEEFYNDGITTGCAVNPLRYCPQNQVTRAEMATFIERALSNFNPNPDPTGMFADVPYPGLEHLTPFIEEFYNDGITTGCAANPLRYCPANKVTRAEMAVFIVRAFDIPLP